THAFNEAVAEATRHIENFLAGLPWYGRLSDWFLACERIGQLCQQDHPYRGAEFIDPYDGARVRFTPVRPATYRVRVGQQILYPSLPGRWLDKAHTRFRHADRDPATGDYPVNGAELGRTLAPSLVHMLDAAMSAHLLNWLVPMGVTD